MPAVLTPLLAVFGIMLIGTLVQKTKLLPFETDQVLNQYVYYIAFPAIMLITLAQTPISDILHWGYIAGFSAAMLMSYAITLVMSLLVNPTKKPSQPCEHLMPPLVILLLLGCRSWQYCFLATKWP